MKCSIMLHFIWVFTVFESTHLGVFQIQRVSPGGSQIQMVNIFHLGYLQTGSLANSEEADEMLHAAAFHQDLRFL